MPLTKYTGTPLPSSIWNTGVDYYFGKAGTKIVARGEGGDYECDGTADDVQLQAAITAIS